MTSSTPLPPEARRILRALQDVHVEYVLVGGLAAGLHGHSGGSHTVTIVPARFTRNLERLAKALHALDARVQTAGIVDQANRVAVTSDSLRRLGRWSMTTRCGPLEIDFEPPATAGHLDLFDDARRMACGEGVEVEVADMADLVRIAEMRLSASDRMALPAWKAALGQPTHA
jgi:hypothetical protein